MDVCLTNYGHCNYVSGKHACIFYDEVRVPESSANLRPLPALGFCSVPWVRGMGWGPLLLLPPWHSRKRRALG